MKSYRSTRAVLLAALLVGSMHIGLFAVPEVSAQTCTTTTTPATTYGQVTQSVSVATAGTYRVWSRIKAPSTANNSYYFQLNNGCAINVGDNASIPANTWTWVNYQNGNTGSYIDLNLTAGTHTLKYTGKEADVQLDRILLLGDMACVPTGTGDNCASADTINPSTSITAPAAGSSAAAGSTVTINASATDNVGVTKVEFYVDGTLKGTDTTAPYSYSWNTTGAASGSHALTSRAYDAAGNTGTSSTVSVTLTGANELVFTPTDDATVIEGSPTTNYGTSTVLQLDNTPAENFLIKMSVSGTAGKTIESAKLRLYNVNASDNGGTFYKAGTSWSQGTVNWSTAPAIGTQVAALGAVTANTWYEIDVKSLITGDGTFALRGKSLSTTGNGADYSSIEGANKPQLIITTGAAVATNVTIPYRMNVAGPSLTDPAGAVWAADAHFEGGNTVTRDPALQINNTTFDALYRTERYGMTAYNVPVANGTYKYRLHFAETYTGCTTVGCRVFSVSAEGSPAVTNLDIIQQVGPNSAIVKEGVATVSDGNLTFGFTKASTSAHSPILNGLEILPNVSADSTPPTVSIAAPANGSSTTAGSTVTINASATDNVGVAKVEFYQGTTLLGTDTSAPFSYAWNTAGVAAGTKSLTAKAHDAAGNVATSAVVSINLTTVSGNGDANNDGRVNALDLSVLISKDGTNYAPADFNQDGTVGAADMAILLSRWTW